jgi:hypothetical protein
MIVDYVSVTRRICRTELKASNGVKVVVWVGGWAAGCVGLEERDEADELLAGSSGRARLDVWRQRER